MPLKTNSAKNGIGMAADSQLPVTNIKVFNLWNTKKNQD
jgi:hypothetical protein